MGERAMTVTRLRNLALNQRIVVTSPVERIILFVVVAIVTPIVVTTTMTSPVTQARTASES